MAAAGDEIVATNGVYATGGRVAKGAGVLTNRVAVTKPVKVRSVNGPGVTVIEGAAAPKSGSGLGDDAVRCAYLGSNAVLDGFTLKNGHTRVQVASGEANGGGAWCEMSATLTNCVIVGNVSGYDGVSDLDSGGGGVFGGTILNCTLSRNTTYGAGGGAFGSTLVNCRVLNNNCDVLGAVTHCTLTNCLVAQNNSDDGPGPGAAFSTLIHCTVADNRGETLDVRFGIYGCTLVNCIVNGMYPNFTASNRIDYSCIIPLPLSGTGNIAVDPAFVDAAAGDYRLRADSACIDTGTSVVATIATDLDGIPRPLDGNRDGVAGPDMGAFEFVPYRINSFLRTVDGLTLTWSGEAGLKLQRAKTLTGRDWSVVPGSEGQSAANVTVAADSAFFRLFKQ